MDKDEMASKRPVYVNGSFVTHSLTGVQRYAYEIVRRLTALNDIDGDPQSGISVITPSNIHMGFVRRNIWEQVDLLAQTFRGTLFSPCNLGPWLHPRQVLTIHDLRPFSSEHADSLPTRTRVWHRASILALSKTVAMMLTGSYFSQSCILTHLNVPADRVRVVYPGADHILQISEDDSVFGKLKLEPQKYVLAVGSLYPHKNLSILHTVPWHDYGLTLCVVGEAPDTNAKAFQRVVREARAQPGSICYAGRRSDAEIKSLYANALAYVFPSLYEGFGFPPLEAMHCGCPVIASNRTSIPEVCGNAAEYFDPLSTEGLKAAIERVISDYELRATLRANGFERVQHFTWDRAARQVLEVLTSL
jgi:glycosyltransferase involved in cell wall biosynthesis